MTKNKFINGVADQTTVRTNDSLYKYNAEKNIWLINRLSKTVDISDYKDDIINDIENKLGTVTASSLGLLKVMHYWYLKIFGYGQIMLAEPQLIWMLEILYYLIMVPL